MKKSLTYIAVFLLFCTSIFSCINEHFDEEDGLDQPRVMLKLCMPESGTKALYQEDGTSYENTILGINYIQIHIFDRDNNLYLGQLQDLKMSGAVNAVDRTLIGTLPEEYVGKNIRLVLMANYNSRTETVFETPTTYADLADFKFAYGSSAWRAIPDEKSHKYIPMEGACEIENIQPAKIMDYNRGHIDLTRAIAKVRIKIDKESKYDLQSLRVEGASDVIFCFRPSSFNKISSINGLAEVLQFTNINVGRGKKYEFYMPEQPANSTSLVLIMKRALAENNDLAETHIVQFKNYSNDKMLPIERNHIYEFVVNKEVKELADIHVTVQPWVEHSVSTVFE